MPLLELRHVLKSYPDGWTLSDVSFSVEPEEVVCLLGPSGCGKTTLLRLIAGLEAVDSGLVLVDGEDVTAVPPHRRGFGLMFQEYALFPHRDAFGNVAFGLRMQGQEGQALEARVAEVLALVGLWGFGHRDVNQLSGGERQRVALARSLAPQPRLLLLDEPLGALDRALRERLLEELPAILRRAGVTTVTVTHDQEEAFAIADRLVLMRAGRVIQIGTPREVYQRPASIWAARFLGLTNLLDARLVGQGRVETPIGTFELAASTFDARQPGAQLQLLIRPDAAQLGGDGPNVVRGTLVDCSFRGERCRLTVRHAVGTELSFGLAAGTDLPAPGEPVALRLDPAALSLIPAGV